MILKVFGFAALLAGMAYLDTDGANDKTKTDQAAMSEGWDLFDEARGTMKEDVANEALKAFESASEHARKAAANIQAEAAAHMLLYVIEDARNIGKEKRLSRLNLARTLYKRFLEQDPKSAEAQSQLGLIDLLEGNVRGDRSQIQRGFVAIDRAAQSDSHDVPARLNRAFTFLNVPAAYRQTPRLIDDLRFLIEAADIAANDKGQGVLEVFLADLLYQSGETDEARALYEAVEGKAADEAQSRLKALESGDIPPSSMARYHASIRSCTLCHDPS